MPNAFLAWLTTFCENLEATPVSQTIQKVIWIIPTAQIIHILAIAAVMGSAFVLNARLAGVLDRDQPVQNVARRFMPVIWWALPVLLLSGLVMIVGEPGRSLKNPIFQTKVLLILVAVAHLAFTRRRLAGGAGSAAGDVLLIVLPSIAIWLAIVSCGRWIAYY